MSAPQYPVVETGPPLFPEMVADMGFVETASDTSQPAPRGNERPTGVRSFALICFLFLTDSKVQAPHNRDRVWQPYVRDVSSFATFMIRFTFFIGFGLDLCLAIKPFEWSSFDRTRSTHSAWHVTQRDDEAYLRYLFYFWASFACALTSCILNLVLYAYSYKYLCMYAVSKYSNLLWAKCITILLVSFSLPQATTWRYIFAISSICISTICGMVLMWCVFRYKNYDTTVNDLVYSDFCRPKVDVDWAKQMRVKHICDYTELLTIRRRMFALHQRGVKAFVALMVLTLVVVCFSVVYEYSKVNTWQPRRMARSNIDNDYQKNLQQYPIANSTNPANPVGASKVFVVVVSGLQYAALQDNTALKDWVTSLGNNAIVYKLLASLPTTSIPNWVSLVSGVSPENSGFLGHAVDGEQLALSPWDTVFRWSPTDTLYPFSQGKLNGVAGADAWYQFLQSTSGLTVNSGTAGVPDWYGTQGFGHKSSLPADEARMQATVTAFDAGYKLFLTQLSNVNTQGNAHGYDSSEYGSAIDSVVAQLETLKARVATDPNAHLIVTSDHGQAKEKGSGGPTAKNQEIPFILYKPGSGISATADPWTGDNNCPNSLAQRQQGWSTVDVAPTIAALLGHPVPRQAEGTYLEASLELLRQTGRSADNGNMDIALLHMQDLFRQKRHFVCTYVDTVLWSDVEYVECVAQFPAPACLTTRSDLPVQPYCACHTAINEVVQYYYDRRAHTDSLLWGRNLCINLAYMLLWLLLATTMIPTLTFCDLYSIFGRSGLGYVEAAGGTVQAGDAGTEVEGPSGAGKPNANTSSSSSSSSSDDGAEKKQKKKAARAQKKAERRKGRAARSQAGSSPNRKAFIVAFLLQIIYWVVALLLFMLYYLITGYMFHTFDNTYWAVGRGAEWFGACILCGLIPALIINRVYKFSLYFKPHRDSSYYDPPGLSKDNASIAAIVYQSFQEDVKGGPYELINYGTPDRGGTARTKGKVGFFRKLKAFLLNKEPDVTVFVYLTKWYLAWWSLVMCLLLLGCGIAHYCGVIPISLTSPFITSDNLRWRFRIMSCLLCGVPLLITQIVQLLSWAPGGVTGRRWDRVYRLRVAADCRRIQKESRRLAKQTNTRTRLRHLGNLFSKRQQRLARLWDVLGRLSGSLPDPKSSGQQWRVPSATHPRSLYLPGDEYGDMGYVAPNTTPTMAPMLTEDGQFTGYYYPNRSTIADKVDYYDADRFEDGVSEHPMHTFAYTPAPL
mmetsp:Transcript_96337/g.166092  ORF Transcript_96337/g.166092 Transcript_96337/m.166092 type:complete len:1239 (-) Transcript_96337:8-3724(-)